MKGLFSISTSNPTLFDYLLNKAGFLLHELKTELVNKEIDHIITIDMPGEVNFNRAWLEFKLDFIYSEGRFSFPSIINIEYYWEQILKDWSYTVQLSIYDSDDNLVPCTRELLENSQ